MADELTDEEKALIAKHRQKTRPARKVRVYGKHDDAEYEFDVEGDDAEAIYQRHKGLWKSEEPAEGDAEPADEGDSKNVKRFGRRVG